MTYDVARLRASIPALEGGTAFFDGPGGTQVPRRVAEAVAATMTGGLSNRGRVTASERRADDVVLGARAAVADLLGCDPGGVVFGRSMTALTYDLARALSEQPGREWAEGDEVVVTRLDHDANIRPWVQAAEARGAVVSWVGFDRDTGDLEVDDVRAVLSPRTRVVAVTGASNVLGTRPDLAAIAAAVHDVGALFVVDGVHLTPHAPVDVAALGADVYLCSPYKFLGPHCGVLAASPALLERLRPAKLLPSSDAVPERFELGTLPYELLAGTTAAIDVLADLVHPARLEPPAGGVRVEGAGADRRARLLASMAAVEAHEAALLGRLLDGLGAIDAVRLHSAPARRTPTAFFSVDGVPGGEVYRRLAERGVNAPASNFYAIEACRWIGLGDVGAVRAGLACYSDAADVDRLLEGVAAISARR